MKKQKMKHVITVLIISAMIAILIPTVAACSTTVSIGALSSAPGETITAPIVISDMDNYGTGTISVTYDHTVVHVTGVSSSPESSVIVWNANNNTKGLVVISAWNLMGVSGDIAFANVAFTAVGSAGSSTPLNLDVTTLADTGYTSITPMISNGSFSIVQEGEQPDLVPTGLEVTHNYYNGAWAMLNNTVNVTVENIDVGDAGAFDVKLYAKLYGDFEVVGSETVTSLPSGNSTEVSFVWKPSEAEVYSLKAVVDSDNSITESNETNNELIEPLYVGYNGYMGDKPLTTYAHGKIKGNISFTHGDSFYSGMLHSDDTYTVHHTVAIPDGATLKFARLYNYWTWCPTNPVMSLTFDGNTISPDREYTDRKGWGYYDYPTGTYGYNVTSFVTGSGSHTTVVTNTGTQSFAMDGIGLLLVYTDTNGKDIEYWINEGADMLSTMDTSGGLMPEEATAQALFSGVINLDTVSGAWLWTIVQSGGCTGNMLMFNDCDWPGVYDGTPYSDLDIDERRDVSGCLNTNDHLVQIRAADYPPGGDYLVPSNAFFVVEYEGEVMIHDINVTTDYTGAVNGIKLLKNGAAIPEGQSLIIGEEYTIRSRIVNEGDFDETVNVTIEVANVTGAVFLENFDKQINVSDSKDAYRTWNTAGLVPGEYSITVNASIPEDAHPADNERTREVILTSEEITYNVTITAEPDEQTTTPNVNATYTLRITNTGTVEDTIELNITA
ncbi:Serine protease, subtilase family, partial [Candidatus Methanophagaceae archaeon]